MSENKSVDLLGLKPIAESARIVTQGSVEGASAFLSRLCLPAAEEFGMLLRDRVSGWRAANAIKIVSKAEALNERRERADRLHGHPRMIMMAIEDGSWSESDEVQDMWAGLLSSSCSTEGGGDDNLVFMNLLRQITSSQARIVNYAVENSVKYKTETNFVYANNLTLSGDDVLNIAKCADMHSVDYQLDHLREIGMLAFPGGFDPDTGDASLSPSSFCISFYVRCQGFVGPPSDYFPDVPLRNEVQETGASDVT